MKNGEFKLGVQELLVTEAGGRQVGDRRWREGLGCGPRTRTIDCGMHKVTTRSESPYVVCYKEGITLFWPCFCFMVGMRPCMFAVRFFFVLALVLHCAGCKEQLARFRQSRASGEAIAAAKPGKGEQVCFECAGKGHLRCGAGGCQSGQSECPAPCLKLSRGKWEHLQVAGHAADELWQKFPRAGGGYDAWNHHHVGEVIQTEGGKPRNIGKCQTCTGTTKVQCAKCAGKGTQSCFVCEGKGVVPEGWTSTDNPRLNNHPDLIRLRDGRSFIGRIAMQSGSFCTIRTRDGKMIEVNSADIVAGIK